MATQPSLPNMTTASKWKSLNETTNNPETSIEVTQVVVTAAQLLALHTTPITIMAAGIIVGEVMVVRSVNLSLNWASGNTAYTLNAGTLKLYYGPTANGWPLTADLSGILSATAVQKTICPAILTAGPDVVANMCQQPLLLANAGSANFTLGNSTLTVTVEFSKTTP
jgi:hypothetical protein